MRKWFELGMKVGCIEITTKLSNLTNMSISPHDIENMHDEILDYIKEMGIDNSEVADAKIENMKQLFLA